MPNNEVVTPEASCLRQVAPTTLLFFQSNRPQHVEYVYKILYLTLGSFQPTVFTLLQQEEVPSSCLPRDLPCLVFESGNTFLPMLDCGKLASNTLFLLF